MTQPTAQKHPNPDGTVDLTSVDFHGQTLRLAGLPNSPDVLLGAEDLLAEFRRVDRMESRGSWFIPQNGFAVSVHPKGKGLLSWFQSDKTTTLTDPQSGGLPIAAIASAIAARGFRELGDAPHENALSSARAHFERSLRVLPGRIEDADDSLTGFDGNANNHAAYLGLVDVSVHQHDLAAADRAYREALVRSWALQLMEVGGRLSKIEMDVPWGELTPVLTAVVRATLASFDSGEGHSPHPGLVEVLSPILTFADRGMANQQTRYATPMMLDAFYRGVGRAAVERSSTVDFVLDALALHWRDVSPLARIARDSVHFDWSRRAPLEPVPFEYLPPYQLLTALVAEVGLCAAAGVDEAELRAHFVFEDDRDRRWSAYQKRTAYAQAVLREVQDIAKAMRPKTR